MSTPVSATPPQPPRAWERRFLLAFTLLGLNCCGAPSCFFFADVVREEVHVRRIEHGYPRVAADDPPARVWRIDWEDESGQGLDYTWSNWTNEEVRLTVGGVQVEFPNGAPGAAYDAGCPAGECTSSVRIGGFICAQSVFGAYATGYRPCSLRVWEEVGGTKGCVFEIPEGLEPNPGLVIGIPGMGKPGKTTEVRPEKCPEDFRWDPGS